VLLVVQGEDEPLLRRFVRLALEVTEQELVRLEVKGRPHKATYRDVETVSFGKDLHLALAGSALLVSNHEKALQRAVGLHLSGGEGLVESRAGAEARKLLPPNPDAWAWLNLEALRRLPALKDFFDRPPDDPNVQLFFGQYRDLLVRSPFVAAGLYHKDRQYHLTLTLQR